MMQTVINKIERRNEGKIIHEKIERKGDEILEKHGEEQKIENGKKREGKRGGARRKVEEKMVEE
jgi:hypothetical protein